MLKKLLANIRRTSRLKRADMSRLQPSVVSPVEPQEPKIPQPNPVTLPESGTIEDMGSAVNEARIMKMVRFIEGQYEEILEELRMETGGYASPGNIDLETLTEAIIPPDWASDRIDLWTEAMKRFHREQLPPPTMIGEQEADPTAISEPVVQPDLSYEAITELASQWDKYPEYNQLSPEIRDNERNREIFYQILSDRLNAELAGEDIESPLDETTNFEQPFAKMFYQSYLGVDVADRDQFFSQLSEEGYRGAAEIDRLDSIFERIPEGFRSASDTSGQRYDPIIGYYSSNKTGGRKALEELGINIPKKEASEKARWISSNPDILSELESDFAGRMMSQDPGVFDYIKKAINPKFDKAIDPGGRPGMVGSEGENIEFGESSDPSALINEFDESVGEGITTEEYDVMRHGLLAVPEKVETLGDRLREFLHEQSSGISQEELSSGKEGRPSKMGLRKMKLEQLGYLVDAYTSAMRDSLEQMFEKLQSGEVTTRDIESMRQAGFVQIKTDKGNVRWALDPGKGLGDLNFSKITNENKNMLPFFLAHLDTAVGDPEKTDQIMSKNKLSLDRDRLKKDPAYAREYGQKIHTMSQMLLDYVGEHVLDMMGNGEVDRDTVIALFNMLKPHSMSEKVAPLLSGKKSNEERRETLRSRIEKSWRMYDTSIENIKAYNKDPKGKKKPTIRKEPSIKSEDVDEMSDDKIRKYLFESLPKDERSRIADHLANIHDFGGDTETSWLEWKKRNSLAMARYKLLVMAAVQIGELLDVKSKLIRYASVSHISDMISVIVVDTGNRLSKLRR